MRSKNIQNREKGTFSHSLIKNTETQGEEKKQGGMEYIHRFKSNVEFFVFENDLK